MTEQVLLYLPVIHAGYEAFLARHAGAAEVLVLDLPGRSKEIRALDPERAAAYLRSTGVPARVVKPAELPEALRADVLVMPDEAVMRELAAAPELADRLAGREVRWERTFLRWDRDWSRAGRPAEFDATVTGDELARSLMARAAGAAGRSSDWWRQVGAVAVRGGEVLAEAYNEHHPSEYAPYLDGDPRDEFRRGVRPDLSTAVHAEAALVARAARTGLALAGADLYVTTFPCPACARLIAEAGFRRCYFAGPYALLDGDRVLRAAGVELIWVRPS